MPAAASVDAALSARATSVAPSGWAARWSRHRTWILVTVLVLGAAGAGFSALGRTWVPVGDDATIELLVRDVGQHTTLVGFNSRFTWNHPAPWTFYLLSVPYALSGSVASSLLVGAGLVNAVFAGTFGWLAHRRGGFPLLAWAGFLFAVLMFGQGYGLLRDPWNPWMAMLPFAVYLLAVWSLACGDVGVLPVAVLAGSYALGNHIGYLALVGGLGVWAVGWMVATTRNVLRHADPDAGRAYRRRLVRALLLGASVAALFWTPIVVEQLVHDPGNVTRTYEFFRSDDSARATATQALSVLGSEIGLRAPWTGLSDQRVTYLGELRPAAPWTALVTLGVFALTGVLAARRKLTDALRLHLTGVVALAIGFVAMLSLRGTRYPYLFRWAWVLGMFAVLASGWALLRAFDGRAAARLVRERLLPVAMVAVVASMLVTQWSDPLPLEVFGEQAEVISDAVVSAVERNHDDDGLVLVRPTGFAFIVPYGNVLVELERAGVPVRVPSRLFIAYGRHRALKPGETATTVVSLVEGEQIEEWKAMPDQTLVVEYVPRSDAARRNRLEHLAVFLSETPVDGEEPPIPFG